MTSPIASPAAVSTRATSAFSAVAAAAPIALTGRDGRRVVFDPPFVLAPMEGVTHPVFRNLILDLGGPGAAWTEFLRVSNHPLPAARIRRHLGPPRADGAVVGVQLMGTDPDHTAESARRAVAIGVPTVDLNFGCPAKVVFGKCAGSALLAHPERLGAIVRATAGAVDVPVTVKIRLGTDDTSCLSAVVDAVSRSGAAALTVHARTKKDGYAHPARWEFLSAVRAMTDLPLIGNGDVMSVGDADRMLAAHGVDGVMVGRGVLRDPWLLARLAAARRGEPGPQIGPEQVLAFHAAYRDRMLATATDRATLGQLKQIYARLEVGIDLGAERRQRLLRTQSIAALEAELAAAPPGCPE